MAQSAWPAARRRVARRRVSAMQVREALAAYLFLLPTIMGLLLFSAGPVIASAYVSLTRWDLLSAPRWIGLANYTALFQDPTFWVCVRNTLYYTVVSVPVGTILALLLALVMNRPLRGISIYRAIYFLPVVSSGVAVALMWQWLYQPDFGLINQVLGWLFPHLSPIRWLSSPVWAMPAIIILSVWQNLGFNMIIFLAGLKGISREYYEAAQIDGAGRWAQLRYVTVPQLSPVTFLVVILGIIGSFQVFDYAFVLTQGGPVDATRTIVYYLFQNGFQWFNMGYAAAIAYILFIMTLVITAVQFLVQRYWVHYE
jgi:multiple sugar transport system permease protein